MNFRIFIWSSLILVFNCANVRCESDSSIDSEKKSFCFVATCDQCNSSFCDFCDRCLNTAESCTCIQGNGLVANSIACDGLEKTNFPIIFWQNDSQCENYTGDNYTINFRITDYLFSEIPAYAINLSVPFAKAVNFVFSDVEELHSINLNAFNGITGAGMSTIKISNAPLLVEIPFDALMNINYTCPISLHIEKTGIYGIDCGRFSDLTKKSSCTWNEIYISSNNPYQIYSGAFSEMIINKLQFSGNLYDVDDEAFVNMKINNLLLVSLNSHQIDAIQSKTFINVTIGNLDLSRNSKLNISANAFENCTINQLDLSDCSLTSIPYEELQNVNFEVVNNEVIKINFDNNLISEIEPFGFSNWKSRQNISFILTKNQIRELKNFAFAGGNWNQIILDMNNITSIQSHAFSNATFQYLSIEFGSDFQLFDPLCLDGIEGTLKLGLFKAYLSNDPSSYYNFSSFVCFKNQTVSICPKNAKTITVSYCTDLIQKIECCHHFEEFEIYFPTPSDIIQFYDYRKLVVPTIKSLDKLTFIWNSNNDRDICFDASDFQFINITTIHLIADDKLFCENALMSLANLSKSLIIENIGFSTFPLAFNNFTKLLHLTIMYKSNDLIMYDLITCDCYLAKNFHQFVQRVNVTAKCKADGYWVTEWIQENYNRCISMNETDQATYDSLDCINYCNKVEPQPDNVMPCSDSLTTANFDGNIFEGRKTFARFDR